MKARSGAGDCVRVIASRVAAVWRVANKLSHLSRRSGGSLPGEARNGRRRAYQAFVGGTLRGNEVERGVTYGRAGELTLLIRPLPEPAPPTPRIAARPRVGQFADRGQCLCTGGRSVGQFNPFLVRHHAGAEGKVEKIMRHGPTLTFIDGSTAVDGATN